MAKWELVHTEGPRGVERETSRRRVMAATAKEAFDHLGLDSLKWSISPVMPPIDDRPPYIVAQAVRRTGRDYTDMWEVSLLWCLTSGPVAWAGRH